VTFLIVSILLSVALTAFIRWRARKAQERAYRAMQEEAERRRRESPEEDDRASSASYGLFPFGGLFEQLFSDVGGTRSFAYDPETGRWVDVSDDEPELPARPDVSAPSSEMPDPPPAQAPPRTTTHRRTPSSPFGGLFGGLGNMGGGGEFDVRSPRDLPRFADVGGMEALKTEIRDSVACS
jgi:hypothetical protein